MTKDYTSEIDTIMASQAALPMHQQRARWAIEADLRCRDEGHPVFVDGRCVRCRVQDPTWLSNIGVAQTTEPLAVAAPCSHYTRDQGCPLHGETCAPEYR